jgi:hypothetical protein
MTSAKKLVWANKELREWWVGVATHPYFNQVWVLAKADLFDQDIPNEQFKGAKLIMDTLQEFAAPEGASAEVPSPGIVHVLPNPRVKKEKTVAATD